MTTIPVKDAPKGPVVSPLHGGAIKLRDTSRGTIVRTHTGKEVVWSHQVPVEAPEEKG